MLRIVAGSHRGRRLAAPPGNTTRPTADRTRQALFDMLWHAPWAGRDVVNNARVLDAFAGTGALGLEAISRGAAHASFIENDAAALAALRTNITRCAALNHTRVVVADALKPPRSGQACSLVFLDPPYGLGLVGASLAALSAAGWIAPGALVCGEFGREDAVAPAGWEVLSERKYGMATLLFMRAPAA